MEQELKKIEKEDGRKRNGGARNNAGRKAFIDKLTKEEQKEIASIAEAKYWLDMAQKDAAPFVRKLVGDSKASWDARLRAAQEILNRALGKPKESLDLTSKGKQMGVPTPEQVARFAKRNVDARRL